MSEQASPSRRIGFYDAFASRDGSGRILRLIVEGLDRSRFEPHVLLAREGPLLEELREQGCPVEVLAPRGPLGSYGQGLLRAGLLRRLHAAVDLHRYSHRMAGWLRDQRIELLHCNQTRAALQASLAARRARVPMVWNVLMRERLPRWLVNMAGQHADRIVGISSDVLDDFPGAPLLRRKWSFVPNGVEVDRFSPEVDGSPVRREFGLGPGDPMVLSAGVLAPRKGHDVLIRAARRILAHFPRARLVIAGGPPPGGDESCGAELQRLCADQGVADRVSLVGRREDMPQMLAACDVFVLASRAEGSPAGVLEAMSSARPVVVTPPAASAVEEGRVGRIIPLDDAEALAEAVVELLADATRARAMGAAGREHVKAHYSVEAMVRGYEGVYWDLLTGRGG